MWKKKEVGKPSTTCIKKRKSRTINKGKFATLTKKSFDLLIFDNMTLLMFLFIYENEGSMWLEKPSNYIIPLFYQIIPLFLTDYIIPAWTMWHVCHIEWNFNVIKHNIVRQGNLNKNTKFWSKINKNTKCN